MSHLLRGCALSASNLDIGNYNTPLQAYSLCQATKVRPHHHWQVKLCQPYRGLTLPRLGISLQVKLQMADKSITFIPTRALSFPHQFQLWG